MKKIFLFVLIIAAMLTSCSVSEMSPKDPVQEVIDEIAGLDARWAYIGCCDEVERMYNALSEEQKQAVTNYDRIAYIKNCAIYNNREKTALERAKEIAPQKLLDPNSYDYDNAWCTLYYPASYEASYEEGAFIAPIYAQVKISYHATNAFGGIVPGEQTIILKLSSKAGERIYSRDWIETSASNVDEIVRRCNHPYQEGK